MEHVRWTGSHDLQRPVIIAGFEGWNDAGDAASAAAAWLRDRWAPEPLAEIDPEEFYDFTVTRPQVSLVDGVTRRIDWPAPTLTWGREAGADVVVLTGIEPQLRWRTYCEQIVAVARSLDARLVLTLGALLAEVPHTRPTSVVGTAGDERLVQQLNLRRSQYEGPTGIVGVLHDICQRSGIDSASLWAAVPAYVPGAPSPKAALALVEHSASLLSLPVLPTDLQIAAADYERQVTDLVLDDDEMTDYVHRLEQRYDSDEAVPAFDSLVDEVERFLRGQPG